MHHEDLPHEVSSEEFTSTPDQTGPPAPGPVGDEVRDILAGVERQLAQLRELQASHDAYAHALAEREQRVEQAEQAEQQWRSQAEEQHQALQRDRESLDDERREFAQQREQAAREREDFHAQRSALDDERSSLEGWRSELEQQRQSIDHQRSAWEEEQGRFQAELDARRSEMDELEQAIAERRQELEAVDRDLAGRQETLTAQENALDEERQRWGEQQRSTETIINERAAEVDRREAELHEQRQTLEADQARLAERESELQQQTERLETERGEVRDQLHDVEARTGQLSRELEQANQRADEAQRGSQEKSLALEQATGTVESLNARIADLESSLMAANERADAASAEDSDITREAERRRDELESELQAARGRAGEAEQKFRQQEQTITELRDRLDHAGAEQQSRLNELEQARQELQRERDSLAQRIEELKSRLAEARSGSDDPDDTVREKLLDDLRNKARRLAGVAEHLGRRRARLKTIQRKLRERPASGAPADTERMMMDMERIAAQQRSLDQQRQELIDLKHLLSQTEQKMIRRWARPRAVVVTAWITLIALIAAGVSWFTADHIFPATVAASVTLQAKGRQVGPLPDENAEAWRSWHAEFLQEPSFRATVAKRMDERRMDKWGDPAVLSTRLKRDLSVDSSEPDSITITLAGTNRQETATMLDILATTAAVESGRYWRQRADGAWAVVSGERQEGGRVCYASLNPKPIEDNRLLVASLLFCVVLALLLSVVMFIYTRLLRAKREFDADGGIFAIEAADAPIYASMVSSGR